VRVETERGAREDSVGVDDAVRDTCEDLIEKDYAERYT
jgi:hypothetical protein